MFLLLPVDFIWFVLKSNHQAYFIFAGILFLIFAWVAYSIFFGGKKVADDLDDVLDEDKSY